MHRSLRYLVPLFLTAALAAPVAIKGIPAPQEAHDQNRVYDKDHEDYHEWNDNENRAWQQSENHHKSYEFSKANDKQQSQYWNWRHSHPDKD